MDDVITLIQEVVIGHDQYGNEIIDTAERELFCRVYGVNRNEFYQAAAVGLKPDVVVRLSSAQDYFGEKQARFHDDEYSIIRAVRDLGSFAGGSGMGLEEIELVLSRKIGDAEDQYLTDENGVALLTDLNQFITARV